jgi:hypothetical protein
MRSNARFDAIMALWFVLAMLSSTAFADSAAPAAERLGTVSFPVSDNGADSSRPENRACQGFCRYGETVMTERRIKQKPRAADA